MNARCFFALLLACLAIFLGFVGPLGAEPKQASPEVENGLPNPSFEQAGEGQPIAWKLHTWRGEGSFEHAETGRTGGRSLGIASEKGGDLSWFAMVPVEPFSTYRLSGWIKTEDLRATTGRGALVNLHGFQQIATPAVTGTNDWTRVEVVFETDDRDSLQVNCLFGGWGLATGKAWYDDLRLERLSLENLEPEIAIDVQRQGEPISKYIYGQFIEHLGRCIYGGIWAEMLEDRKFFFPVTATYDPYREARGSSKDGPFPVVGASPWEIFGKKGDGDDGGVAMLRADSFVGEQTPRIGEGCGIRQNDLGLVRGKEYVGYVWIKPVGKTTTVRVSLAWGNDAKQADQATFTTSTEKYTRHSFRFTSAADTSHGRLSIGVTGGGPCLLGTVSLMPADHVEGMRADTLGLLAELDSPIYRWPGGNFVSGYDWTDGIGDRDRRPPRTNPAWTGVEHNDFGIDEFLAFCRRLKTEPLVVVNSGQGGTRMALDELLYANAPADTPMGRLRAENGHPEPYGVTWWGVGNEMYGKWQLGHMPLAEYVVKHNAFADALRAADPAIKLIAVGSVGPWSEGMMTHSADHMDLISEHFYVREKPGLMTHVAQPGMRVRQIADAHRGYRKRFDSLRGKNIRIALDEWNYWYGPHLFGELGTRYYLKDALGVAGALNEFARNSDLYFMANYAQTVNVIGAIKTSKTAASFAATGLPLSLYRRHFGVLPVAAEAGRPLDVAAALRADGKTLTVAIVNPTRNAYDVPLAVRGAKPTSPGRLWRISDPDPRAYNEPGEAPGLSVEEATVGQVGPSLSVAPCSVTLFALPLE